MLAPALSAQVNYDGSPESNFVNQQYSQGLAAGNSADWYLNCDGNHASLNTNPFQTLNRYPDGTAYYYQTGVRDKPRNILGNASLSPDGLNGLTRYNLMTTYRGDQLYTQYRANQHYFYPAVRDTGFGLARDKTYAMYPYVTQTVGKSSSEKDELRKFFLAMAAFRPAVKTILEDERILIPTLQMIFRRTRVSSDAEYLTGLAHPSAFADNNNELDMVEMANEITTDTIPPLVQMELLEENFSTEDPNDFNERYVYTTGEEVFTTPCAIGRVWRGPEQKKEMYVRLSDSIDVNDLDLTFEYVVLRGDASKVNFTPLTPDGSEVKIEIDYFESYTDQYSGEISNMLVIGVFAYNGHYYSSPAFITCATLWNETRTYDGDDQLERIDYANLEIENNVSYDRAWKSDLFEFDVNGRLYKIYRDTGSSLDAYIREGFQVLTEDADGRATEVAQVSYSSSNGVTTVAPTYDSSDWRYSIDVVYDSVTLPTDGSYRYTASTNDPSFSPELSPEHGDLTLYYYRQGISAPGFKYTPEPGFTGVDVFTVREYNSVAQATTLHKIRAVVGPTDNAAPTQATGLQVLGESIEEARLLWDRSTDNYEVYRYQIYRDGSFLGHAYREEYTDTSVTPGAQYDYAIYAEDDAGNLSPVSATATGSGAAIFGQDNFDDDDINAVDGSLTNGLSWNLLSGNEVGGQAFRPGRAASEETNVITDQSITPPFTLDFKTSQQYCTTNNGPILLYQDVDNFYHFTINRDFCQLYRRMDGVDTLIGSDGSIAMNKHQWSSARYQITVTATGGVIAFKVVKSEWTESPDAVYEGFFYDDNAAAVAKFTGGPIGFKQWTLSTYNCATYDDLYLSREDGQGRDIDGDGLVDAWEIAFFGSMSSPDAAPGADPDNDGVSTEDEQLWGTNPAAATSRMEPSFQGNAGSGLSLSWPSIPGRLYTVRSSSDLVNWNDVPGMIDLSPTPPDNSVDINLPTDSAEFFRVEVRAAP